MIADYEYIPDALDNLVLPKDQTSLLKAVCDAHKVETLHISTGSLDQDRSKTKEGSHVVLLHGGPGSGKSFIAGL